jgi:hypothetical protein
MLRSITFDSLEKAESSKPVLSHLFCPCGQGDTSVIFRRQRWAGKPRPYICRCGYEDEALSGLFCATNLIHYA